MQRVALRPTAEQLVTKVAEIVTKLRSSGCTEAQVEIHALRLFQARTKPKVDHFIRARENVCDVRRRKPRAAAAQKDY
jgi:hypothetical protein